jgi:TRAP-type C4-dicarboxylate transport system substrate-binding protein
MGVSSENIADLIKTLNGTPIMMPISEVYTALQQDRVDGHLGTPAMTLHSKFYDLEKYGFISPPGIRPVHVIANLNSWNNLSSAQQRIIEQGFNEMADDLMIALRKGTLGNGVSTLRQLGMKIHIQSAEEMDPLRYAMAPGGKRK